jgi:hypothetical protein
MQKTAYTYQSDHANTKADSYYIWVAQLSKDAVRKD